MKKIFLAVSLLISVVVYAQSTNESDVRNVLEKQIKAWNNGDIPAFMEEYWNNDSLMFVGKSGVTYGWTNTLNHYKAGYPDTAAMGKLSFTIISATPLSAEYFHITGKFHLKRSIGDLEGYFTLLFRKINGAWKIIVDHTS